MIFALYISHVWPIKQSMQVSPWIDSGSVSICLSVFWVMFEDAWLLHNRSMFPKCILHYTYHMSDQANKQCKFFHDFMFHVTFQFAILIHVWRHVSCIFPWYLLRFGITFNILSHVWRRVTLTQFKYAAEFAEGLISNQPIYIYIYVYLFLYTCISIYI